MEISEFQFLTILYSVWVWNDHEDEESKYNLGVFLTIKFFELINAYLSLIYYPCIYRYFGNNFISARDS